MLPGHAHVPHRPSLWGTDMCPKLGPEEESWGHAGEESLPAPGTQWHTQLSEWAAGPKVTLPWGWEGVWAR